MSEARLLSQLEHQQVAEPLHRHAGRPGPSTPGKTHGRDARQSRAPQAARRTCRYGRHLPLKVRRRDRSLGLHLGTGAAADIAPNDQIFAVAMSSVC